MNRTSILGMLAAGVFAAQAFASPAPADFAYGKRLTLAGKGAVYEFDLPEEVYRRTVQAGMEGVGVFNSEGELVPYRIFLPAPRSGKPRDRTALPFFPVSGSEQGTESLSVLVRRGQDGEILSLRQDRPTGSTGTAYLVDLTSVGHPVGSLELEWDAAPGGLMGKTRVEESDDLKRWQLLADGETVANLEFGGHLLERRRVELSRQSRPYLRLTFQGVPESFRLENVTAVLNPVRLDPPRQRLTIPCRKLESNEYAFSLPGPLPVDRIQVKPPQPNTVARVVLFSRAAEGDPWSRRNAGLVYRLMYDGEVVSSRDIAVGASGHVHWLMRVGDEGGGLGDGVPDVEVGWIAHRVRFVARGAGPFLLAYGSGRDDLTRFRAEDALLRLTTGRNRLPLGRAELGPEIVLGGPQSLRPGISPLEVKTIILWAALGASVILLGSMALSLYRRMNRKRDNPRAE